MDAYESLRKLVKEELYADAVVLGGFLCSRIEHDSECMTPSARFQSFVLYADALLQLERYRQAEINYYKALQSKRNSSRSPETRKAAAECTSENEMRYRLYKCLLKQRKYQESVGVLEAIPNRLRAPKVRAALAQLYSEQDHCTQMPASSSSVNVKQLQRSAAFDNYKALLKDVPYALSSTARYLQLGSSSIPEEETDALVNGTCDWLQDWVRAQVHLSRHEYKLACQRLRELTTRGPLTHDRKIAVDLGVAHCRAGESEKAIFALDRAHSIEPTDVEGMDLLAALLAQEDRVKQLESLATRLARYNPQSTETWIALGYLCRSFHQQQTMNQNQSAQSKLKLEKALYFAHKACTSDQRSIPRTEAMLLKGRVLMESSKVSEASKHFQEALIGDRRRFELYEALINCYVGQNKLREARVVAKSCREFLGQFSPRPLMLTAFVLSKDTATEAQARNMLERALAAAPHLLNAVYLLVELYDKAGLYEKAIAVLRAQTRSRVNSKLHRLLGDFLSKANRGIEAADSYRFALTLNPTDHEAGGAMSALDNMPQTALLLTPDVCASAETPSSSLAAPAAGAPAAFAHLSMAPLRRGGGRLRSEHVSPYVVQPRPSISLLHSTVDEDMVDDDNL